MEEGDFIDFNLYGSNIMDSVITNPLHLFFQEIELAVKIEPGELWGSRDSIELSRYLFNQYITTEQIKKEISVFITTYCAHASQFQHDINIEIMKIENNDLIYINVTVFDSFSNKEFIQRFLLGN